MPGLRAPREKGDLAAENGKVQALVSVPGHSGDFTCPTGYLLLAEMGPVTKGVRPVCFAESAAGKDGAGTVLGCLNASLMPSVVLMTSWDGRPPSDLEFPTHSDEALGVVAY